MKKLLLCLFVILSTFYSKAQMTTRVIADSVFIPWELVYGPDNHIWFTQKNGYICRLDPVTEKLDTIYHESSCVIQNEGGMLGMALHPDFTNNPYVYVAYNYLSSSYKERIVRYTYNGSTLQSPTTLLDDINSANVHNGCRLAIINNQLFITTGDAANSSIAQDVSAINGKTLRINLDGSIPNDNPDPSSPVWSWGHRNAQGIVYANGKIYSSEHGPANDDELNILVQGRNFGWPEVQGYCNTSAEMTFCNDSNVVEPIIAWTPTIAVSGIDYYNHPMFPSLQGSILMTTLKNRNLHILKLNSTYDDVVSDSVLSLVSGDRLRDICIDPEGRIYISTSNSTSSGTGVIRDRIIEIYDPNYVSVNQIEGQRHNAVNIYPNPAENMLNVSVSTTAFGKYSYKIISAAGRDILHGNIGRGLNTINVNSLSSGTYHILVESDKNVIYTGKLVKQ